QRGFGGGAPIVRSPQRGFGGAAPIVRSPAHSCNLAIPLGGTNTVRGGPCWMFFDGSMLSTLNMGTPVTRWKAVLSGGAPPSRSHMRPVLEKQISMYWVFVPASS